MARCQQCGWLTSQVENFHGPNVEFDEWAWGLSLPKDSTGYEAMLQLIAQVDWTTGPLDLGVHADQGAAAGTGACPQSQRAHWGWEPHPKVRLNQSIFNTN